MKIQLIVFGKIRNPEIGKLLTYYLQLINKYVRIEVIELKDHQSKVGAKNMGKYLGQDRIRIMLSEEGKQYTTLEFSEKLSNFRLAGKNLQIVIGNAYGVMDDLKQSADLVLSLGQMTFPHEFSVILITEQLFRCFNLTAGGKYHK